MSESPRPLGRVLLFSGILVLLCLGVIELALSVVYFQRHSEQPLAIVQALRTARTLLQRPTPVGIWRTDPRYGYVHIPGATGIHRTADFEVRYTIGDDGNRVIPAPPDPRGEILFLGGSYTFGHGVEDAESYPARLAAGPWSTWWVRNRAVMGWGTTHAYLALSDRLAAAPPPALVLYAMIEAHVMRNSVRASWVKTLTAYDRLHPHFELVAGAPVFQGVVDESGAVPDSPELRRKELALTAAFLKAMRDACRARGVAFAVILLGDDWSVPVVRLLATSGIPLVDLSGVPIEGFAGDIHPNPEDHARLAAALADSFVGQWVGRGRLAAPLSETTPGTALP